MGGSEEDVGQFNLKRKIENSEAYRLAENFFIGRWDPIGEVYNLMNKLCATVARLLKPIIEAEIQTLTVPYFQATLISLAIAWNRCEEESLCLEREEIRKKNN